MQLKSSDLQLVDVTKNYGIMTAVDRVSLHIRAGEMVALLGPSGCGKTTTLRMIAGLVQQSSGDIKIGGRSVTNIPVHRRNIGMLFQNYALFPHVSVAQNLAFGLEMRRVSKAEIAARVAEALALVQLERFADRLPGALSGGQQQRVALARALVIEPSILLLDEPLGALDKSLREDMQVELRQLQQRLGITTVMVTHDQDEAQTLADRIVIMRSGEVEQVGTPREIYAEPATRFVAGFIGAGNFLSGRLLSRNGDEALIDIGGGARAIVSGLPDPSGEVTILLRPEAIEIHELASKDMDEANFAYGTVEQIIYRGPTTHLYLRLRDGNKLVAHRQNNMGRAVSVGDAVTARWSAASNRLVQGE